MKRLLYVTFHDLNPSAGVSKKIIDQVNSFKKHGIETRLLSLVTENSKRIAKIDNQNLTEIRRGMAGQIKIIAAYKEIIKYIKQNHIDSLYIRYTQTADPFFINFIKNSKRLGCKILLEIPTFPYDGEFTGQNFLLKIQILIERIFRRQLKKYVDYIVTTSNIPSIFNIKTIRISNAVNANLIPLVQKKTNNDELVLISVATISFWHGLDRMILGLKKYYSNHPTKLVKLIIIGSGDQTIINDIQNLIKSNNLQSYIDYVGPKSGIELDRYYNQADLAVGCLACHRKKIEEVKSLKNVDYAMRGLPMFYSESNSDFDNMPYVFKVPADDTPIEVQSLINFIEQLNISASEIRKSVANLTWDEQVKKIIKYI